MIALLITEAWHMLKQQKKVSVPRAKSRKVRIWSRPAGKHQKKAANQPTQVRKAKECCDTGDHRPEDLPREEEAPKRELNIRKNRGCRCGIRSEGPAMYVPSFVGTDLVDVQVCPNCVTQFGAGEVFDATGKPLTTREIMAAYRPRQQSVLI